jgi:predicted nucleic acid-binding Zn finger protein
MTTPNSAPQVNPIAQIKALHDRLIKAEALVAEGKVNPLVNLSDHYIVEGSQGYYLVNGTCECADFTNRSDLIKTYCKHRLAALLYAEQADRPKATRKSKAESPERDEDLTRKINELYR